MSRIASLRLALTITLTGLFGLSTIDGSLKYKRHWYFTTRLCPDLQDSDSDTGKDVDSTNQSPFQLIKQKQTSDSICFLESSDSSAQISKALIAGVHIDTRTWSFFNNASTSCKEHIKIRVLPKSEKSDVSLNMMCRVPRKPEFHDDFDFSETPIGISNFIENMAYISNNWNFMQSMTPSLWELGNWKLVISFPSFNLTHLNDSQANEERKDYWDQYHPVFHAGNKYIQIVFIVQTADGDCNVQIQQYLVKNKEKTHCEYLHRVYPFRLCGVYGCDKIREILHAIGFWDKKSRQIQRQFLADINRDRYYGYLVKLMAFLTAPLLIFGGCYAFRKFKVREVINRDRLQHYFWRSLRGDSGRYINNCNASSTGPSAIRSPRPPMPPTVTVALANPVVIPLVHFDTECDPPPPYDCVDKEKLPTYEEATKL